MIDYEYIGKVLERFESRQLVAYIPCSRRNFTGTNDRASCGEVLGVSGVTVATGLDLGQQSRKSLDRMGIPDDIMVKLMPYVGLRREEAVSALRDCPLTLTDREVTAIDRCVHAEYIRRAVDIYDKAQADTECSDLRFIDIPRQAQAVIVSLYYQLGAWNGTPGYRTTWKYLVACDWCAAARELMTGFRRYPQRRKAEGVILKEIC